jgi:hypothetical protein
MKINYPSILSVGLAGAWLLAAGGCETTSKVKDWANEPFIGEPGSAPARSSNTWAAVAEKLPEAAEAANPPPRQEPARLPAETQIEDKTLYEFQAAGMELKTALATFARANNLNIVPDNDVTGVVTLDVRNLPLKQMMRALLEASDASWHEESGLIRVHNTETRTFSLD